MKKMFQKYTRLLSYENACLLIDFVNSMDGDHNYANITPGGVSLYLDEEALLGVKVFLDNLEVRYEINDEHPERTNAGIVNFLKEVGIIDPEN